MKICTIIVDGMRPDALASIPAAQKILADSVSTMSARTVFPSVTLPCHISLFHSVDPERHGTVTNTYAPMVRPIRGICEVLKHSGGKSCALFYDWEEIRDVARPNSMKAAEFRAGRIFGYDNSNTALADKLVETLKASDYDFTFWYHGITDWAGHKYGWMTEEYLNAMKLSFENIARVKEALGDEYLFIITADHGGHDRGHGLDIAEDMTIPMIFYGNTEGLELDLENASIKDIAPTVAELLGVAPDEDWEGKSLIKK